MENHVRLRWASHQGTVLSVFDALLAAETLVDVTLAADGQYLRAHKILLSACSPYFQELLSLDTNKNPIIFMKDVKYSELKALVQFIYRGEVNIAQDDLPSFLAVAQSLKIRGLASMDTPANNIGSDTLILPDFNLPSSSASKPTGPGPSSAGINTMANTYERHEPPPVLIQGYHQPAPYTPTPTHGNQAQTQSQSSIPNISDLRSSGPIVPPVLPPPAKRLRVQQHPRDRDPLEFNPVNVSMSGPTVQSRTMPSSQIYDPLSLSTQTQGTSHTHMAAPDPDQGHLKNNQMDDEQQTEQIFQPDEVKVEVGNDQIHAMVGVYDEAEEVEEEDNSMSQSSYSESWKHDESHDFQDNSMLDQEQDDDGEMPGTSGTGNEAGTSGQASGRQGEDLIDWYAPESEEVQLDPLALAPTDPIPVPVQIDEKWCTVCQRSGHTDAGCWHLRTKEQAREYYRMNPEKKTNKNRRSNRSKRRCQKKKLMEEQIKTNRLQAENLQLKLQHLEKKN